MSSVAELFSAEDIVLDLDAPDKVRVFKEAAQLLERRQGVAEALTFDKLSARERLGSTGLGHGVAIPHARVEGLSRALVAFVRTKSPIPFDAADGKPVWGVLVLLVPKQATDQHLLILAEVARMFNDQSFLDRLRACTSPAEAYRLFATWRQP